MRDVTRSALLIASAFLATSIAMVACPTDRPPVTPDGGTGGSQGTGGSIVVVDAGLDECTSPSDDCAAAACTLKRLQCTFSGMPAWHTPQGTEFAVVCRRAAASGRDWHPRCIRSITSCSQLDSAYRGELCLD